MPENSALHREAAAAHGAEMYVRGSTATVAWGRGAHRTVFDTSPQLAYAVVRYAGSQDANELASWLADEAALSASDADEVAGALVREGYLNLPRPTPGERTWEELGWTDAASVFTSAYDTRWVHDYRGNPIAMVRDADGANIGADDEPPPPAWKAYSGVDVDLPEPARAERSMVDVLQNRRTRRHFRRGTSTVADIATVCRWALGRQESDASRFVSHTYVESGPVLGFVLVDRESIDGELAIDGPDGRFALSLYRPDIHALRVFDATDSIGTWADLLWTQGYGENAGFALALASDVRQYLRKYPNPRSYTWMSSDAGAFMHTAIVAAHGVGLSAFQTPATDDELLSRLLRLNRSDIIPAYFGLFGR